MRALRVTGRDLILAETPVPEPNGEALVRVLASGICNTDVEIARGYAGFSGTIGHEFIGVVEDDGGGAIPRGSRVVGEINAGCGTCARCVTGDSRHCKTRTVLGIVGRDGAHADYLRLPARNLLPVPATISNVQAVFVEPLAAACGVLERCTIDTVMRVAVIGDGKLGLLCAMVLAANGHRPVLIGKHEHKLAIARRHDIETSSIEDARKRGHSFDVVVEASGAAAGFELALDILEPRGALVLKSTFHGATPIDASRVVVDEVRVIGSRCGRFAPALDLLARKAIDVDSLVSEILPRERALEGMMIATRPGVLKVLLAEDHPKA